MSTTATDKEDEYGGTELILINVNTDLFNYVVPLDGRVPADRAKKIAAQGIAQMIIEKIQPEFIEQEGFEIMQYSLVIKKYEE